jgi:hypothetical protein
MLNLTCLDGPLQGKKFSLFKGLKISSKKEDTIVLNSIQKGFYIVEVSKEQMHLVCKDKAPKLLLVDEGSKQDSIKLEPGLNFCIGFSTFIVQKSEIVKNTLTSTKATDFTDFLKEVSKKYKPKSDSKLLETPLRFDFVRGFWLNQSWIIQHTPIDLGTKSPIYFFCDPSIPTEDTLFKIHQIDKDVVFTTNFSNFIYINGKAITSQKVQDGDFVEFGGTAFNIVEHQSE